MQLRRVRDDAAAVERFDAECWFPYQEELSETVGEHALSDEADRRSVAEHLRDVLESPTNRLWVALDGAQAFETFLSRKFVPENDR